MQRNKSVIMLVSFSLRPRSGCGCSKRPQIESTNPSTASTTHSEFKICEEFLLSYRFCEWEALLTASMPLKFRVRVPDNLYLQGWPRLIRSSRVCSHGPVHLLASFDPGAVNNLSGWVDPIVVICLLEPAEWLILLDPCR
jgi:hypothetical protein